MLVEIFKYIFFLNFRSSTLKSLTKHHHSWHITVFENKLLYEADKLTKTVLVSEELVDAIYTKCRQEILDCNCGDIQIDILGRFLLTEHKRKQFIL